MIDAPEQAFAAYEFTAQSSKTGRTIHELFFGRLVADNARVFSFALDDADRASIETVLGTSHDLFKSIGDCGSECR